jgi:methyl-accepting chemotaxis protein
MPIRIIDLLTAPHFFPMFRNRLARLNAGTKFAIVACALAALVVASFTLAVTHSAGEQVDSHALARVDSQNRSIATMIGLYDDAVSAEVSRFMTMFAHRLPADFTLDTAHTVDIGGKATPTLNAGD